MSAQGVIVMAVHRPPPDLLSRQVASLKAQTLGGWRCLIGVDGHEPAATTLLDKLVGADDRFHVTEFADNVGVYRHFERLLAVVPNDAAWVALCDQDDYWYPHKLGALVECLDRDGARAALGQARIIQEPGGEVGRTRRLPGNLRQTLLRNQMTGSLSVVSQDVVQAALPFPSGTRIAIHDHWLAVCAAALGSIEVHDGLVQDYVQHRANVLGEAAPLRVPSELRQLHAAGGGRAYLDVIAGERWGWRVVMARALLERGLAGQERRFLQTVAEGGVSTQLVRAVVDGVGHGHLELRRALGILAGAWWWKRSRLQVPSS